LGPLIPYVQVPELPLPFLVHLNFLPDLVNRGVEWLRDARLEGAAELATLAAIAGVVVALNAEHRRGAVVRLAAVWALASIALAVWRPGALYHVPSLTGFDPRHPPSIKPFGTIVAIGVYVGSVIAMRHARERGIDQKKQSEFIFWVLVAAFVSAHVLDSIFYHPAEIMRRPLYIFMIWEGLSSYGGFVGAAIGAFAWRRHRKEPITPMVEMFTSAFPLAWVFGRTGCSMVHDHPGNLSDAWFAVRWPVPGGGFVGRYDLGLYEMVLTIPLAVTFLVLWKRQPFRPLGFYTGWMCVAYAPVRFLLDFLREREGEGIIGGDPRYGGLTPAQWGCFGLVLLGVYFLRMASRPESATAPPRAEAAGGHDGGPESPPNPQGADGDAPATDPPDGGEPAP
jgi:phosphatidylglycerol---prolipoprotein diacylglyceryl transferase